MTRPANALLRPLAWCGLVAALSVVMAGCNASGEGRIGTAPAATGGAPSGAASVGSAGTTAASPGAVSPVIATREWRWERVDGLEVDTHNWRIRTSLRSARFASTLPAFYEAALANFRGGLVPLPAPSRKLEAFVFGTRDEWAQYTQHKLGRDAGPYLKMGRGGFTSEGEAVLYDIGPRDTLAIAAHEGWHQYTQTTFRSQLPVWLEEGIACYMEGFRLPPGAEAPTFLPWRNSERYAELRTAARKDRLSSLRDLLDGSPQTFLERSRDAQLAYYAQVWALVHFLREGEGGRYRAALATLLDDAVHGRIADRIRACQAIGSNRAREAAARSRTGPWLILAYFNEDVDEFSRGYDRFVGALLESNSWDRIMRGESPLQGVEGPGAAAAAAPASPTGAAPAKP
jgi:hypothetical protein